MRAYRLVALQMSVAGIVALSWLLSGWVAAVSALLGGFTAAAPSFYFTHRFFAVTHARQVDRILKAFYWGELTKILLIAFLVIAITRVWPAVAMAPFFSGFVAAYLGFWGAPLLMRKQN